VSCRKRYMTPFPRKVVFLSERKLFICFHLIEGDRPCHRGTACEDETGEWTRGESPFLSYGPGVCRRIWQGHHNRLHLFKWFPRLLILA
jgi:hypothetical protein